MAVFIVPFTGKIRLMAFTCAVLAFYTDFLLPTSQPSEDARLVRRQKIVPREESCMQKNSRSSSESVSVSVRCKVVLSFSQLLVFSATQFKIDQNQNQNRSINKVQNLGNERR